MLKSLPTVVLGGAGLVMFVMVAATGINALIVAISIGIGMIPLIAPNQSSLLLE